LAHSSKSFFLLSWAIKAIRFFGPMGDVFVVIIFAPLEITYGVQQL
jgi:hypothetical protein